MSASRPLIGVTSSEVRIATRVVQTPEGEPPSRELALSLKYLAAVEAAGGLPVILPPLDSAGVEPLLDRLSGLCLSGGPDIDPATYGGPDHPALGPTEPDVDRFEALLTASALEREMPILAICRGAQMLNVVLGGDLHQHLPDAFGIDLSHRQLESGAPAAAHSVEIGAGSTLELILGSSERVNSFHHQAIRRPGTGLEPVAWAPDGVIEAVEFRERDFVLGVQWHAEGLIGEPHHDALFDAFIEAAARYDEPAQTIRRVA